ncbi:hypothetical protein [Paenibacillus agri]|uniref:Uncharacterized protein n=1 Tax=Paenibacillus agri TaxID=2744309 RepID=A0A850EIB8_9BACL|nr:hypothetical protein [Paenibacillus agri]NUU61093.1 hypothetical protein [Paenibacillus agri]
MLDNEKHRLIDDVLSRLSRNQQDFITREEYLEIEYRHKDEWFTELNMDSKVCSLCMGRSCNIEFHPLDRGVPCPHGENQIIKIEDSDRISYKFGFDQFINEIQSSFGINQDIKLESPFYLLGDFNIEKDDWQILFCFKKHLSLGALLEFKYKNQSPLTLIIVDTDGANTFDNAILKTFGVLVVDWNENPVKYLEQNYEDKPANLLALKELSQNAQLHNIINEQLKRTASDGKGTPFEKSVFEIIEKIFNVVIPFGGNLSGFSIPDGLIMADLDIMKYQTLFYDCKSFIGDRYKHSAGIPMQVNYYHDFLNAFYNVGSYNKTGFIIFANSFPEIEQKQITGSPQWKYVFENFKIFFINVAFLSKANELFDIFTIQGDQMNKTDLIKFYFHEDLSVLQDSEVENYYKLINNKSAYENYGFLSEVEAEIGIVLSVINSAKAENYPSIESHLKDVLKRSKHDNLKKSVSKPILTPYLREFVKMAKEEKLDSVLHPLSILLTLNRFDDDLNLQLNNYDILYQQTKDKLVELIAKI